MKKFVRRLVEKFNEGKEINPEYVAPGVVVLVVLLSYFPFLPMARSLDHMAWASRYDHDYAKRLIKKMPEDSIVLTHVPAIFLLNSCSAIQTYAGRNNPEMIENMLNKYHGNVYYYYNYWCNITDISNTDLKRSMEENYNLELIDESFRRNYRYALYKVSLLDDED